MIIERTKLFYDKYFDIRSYELERAKGNIICKYGNKKMTLTPEDQETKKLLINKAPFQSKINPDQTYYIYSYLFIPDKELTPDERLERDARAGVFG